MACKLHNYRRLSFEEPLVSTPLHMVPWHMEQPRQSPMTPAWLPRACSIHNRHCQHNRHYTKIGTTNARRHPPKRDGCTKGTTYTGRTYTSLTHVALFLRSSRDRAAGHVGKGGRRKCGTKELLRPRINHSIEACNSRSGGGQQCRNEAGGP